MDPRAFLNLLHREWKLVVELFEANRTGPIDHASLLQLIEAHKRSESDVYPLFERLLDHGILGQPLSGETLYQLGGLTETVVSQLLDEHRLGLSESIQAHIKRLDDLSQQLLLATTEHDGYAISNGAKKLYQQTQDVKHLVHNNLQAIRNIVSDAKKLETNRPIKQRYADVIDAWEQYITPMGNMIDVQGAFDSMIDSAIGRMDQAIAQLDSAGALISESATIRYVRQMLNDMRWHIVRNFQTARDLLKPLYEVARLNSKVTRGASIVLDMTRKQRFREIEPFATLDLYRKPRLSLVSPNTALLRYYFAFKEVKEKPSPKISVPSLDLRRKMAQEPPPDRKRILNMLRNNLPVPDLTAWAIKHFPEHPTDKIFGIILIVYSEASLTVSRQGRSTYLTKTHHIAGPKLEVGPTNG
jgi:hypothetical protein